jgi:hypothetical protein
MKDGIQSQAVEAVNDLLALAEIFLNPLSIDRECRLSSSSLPQPLRIPGHFQIASPTRLPLLSGHQCST